MLFRLLQPGPKQTKPMLGIQVCNLEILIKSQIYKYVWVEN